MDTNRRQLRRQVANPESSDHILENPITGSKLKFIRIPPNPNEGSLEFELTIASGFVPATGRGKLFEIDRSHPQQKMHLEVIEGILRGTINDQSTLSEKYALHQNRADSANTPQISPQTPIQIVKGQSIDIERGVGRRFWNGLQNAETRVRVRLTPPINSFDFIMNGYEKAWRRAEETRIRPENQEGNQKSSTAVKGDSSRTTDYSISAPFSLYESFQYGRKEMRWKPIFIGGSITFLSILFYLIIGSSKAAIEGGLVPVLGSSISKELTQFAVNVVPTILLIPVFGYLVRVSRNVLYGYASLPEFENWKLLAEDGVKTMAIYLLFLFYPLYAGVSLFGVGGGVVLQLFRDVLELKVFLTLAGWYVFPAAYMRFVETEQLRSLLDRRALLPVLQTKSYLRVFLTFSITIVVLGTVYLLGAASSLSFGSGALFLWMGLGSAGLFFSVVALTHYLAKKWIVITSGANQGREPIREFAIRIDEWLKRRNEKSTVAKGHKEGTSPSERESNIVGPRADFRKQLQQLQQLHEYGILTAEEYSTKRQQLISRHMPLPDRVQKQNPAQQLNNLEQMRNRGVITDSEFKQKRRELFPNVDSEQFEETSTIEKSNVGLIEQFDRLRQLHEYGLLTDEEYESKQRQLEPDREETLTELDSELVTQLQILEDLYRAGVLSDKEFEQKREKITRHS